MLVVTATNGALPRQPPAARRRRTRAPRGGVQPGVPPVFETIAFLSTLMFIAVFIFLFRMDRASRRNDEQ